MYENPRQRRLRSDLAALERLREESSVLRFRASGRPAQQYVVEFRGRGLARVRGKISVAERHEVEIRLGSSYPRTMPELRWMSPIHHPNISEIGMVCLGGYGTHWVPSLNLDELCVMLWDMVRYHNYDVRSPYNRDAALWVANQSTFSFPIDARPLRDLRAALGRVDPKSQAPSLGEVLPGDRAPGLGESGSRASRFVGFLRGILPERNERDPTPPRSGDPLASRFEDLDQGPESVTSEQSPAPLASVAEPEGLVILEDEPEVLGEPAAALPSETRPAQDLQPTRLRAADEEIIFLD